MADGQNDNTTCVVCFKNVLYYSIGECDHPVCFECSTRMRVLCLQNECPICRHDLARVVFTDTVLPYKELQNKAFSDKMLERQFKIWFCSEEIKHAYEALLENHCRTCEHLPPFRSFNSLSDHMRKVHERYYCDLCVKHLKIFTSERRCYTRQELAHHRRKGDLDDTSHRGHPLCEFCEERFMDADELYRHLRKEHLYCHLCDADGRNHYYASHSALAHHFRTDHYLCEEGECAGQHLTAVFRSEIDLKGHKATIHGKGLTRNASRQARTLELQFNITPHPHQHQRNQQGQRNNNNNNNHQQQPEPPLPPSPTQVPPPRIDTRSDEHFPRLSAAGPAPMMLGAPTRHGYKGPESLARTDRNFPTLGGGGGSNGGTSAPPRPASSTGSSQPASAVLKTSKPSISIQLHSQPTSASNFRLTQATGNRISAPPPSRKQPLTDLNDDDFPSLGIARDDHPSIGASTLQPAKVTLINSQEMQALKKTPSNHQSKKPQLNAEAFPALSSSSAPSNPPQWIKISKSKEKAKPAKPEPPPPKEPNFNPVADFPTLPMNVAKPPKKVAPAPKLPSSQIENVTKATTKKEKKKNNANKKENLMETNNFNLLNEKKITRDMSQVLSNVNNNSSEEDKKIKTVDTSSNSEKNRNGGGNGDFNFAAKDYPPLSGKSTSNSTPRMQSNANSTTRMQNGTVPPGFTKPRPACDGMTFTNSAGQTFSAPLHSYIPPPEFEQRNRALVKKFAVALGGPEAVEDFKVASRAFRDSMITADEFYKSCQAALGSQLEDVFPELVALLPDIAKQQELVVGRKASQLLDVCPTCGQLLAPADGIVHDTAHWPPLAAR